MARNYDDLTVADLKQIAKSMGIVGYSKKPRAVIISMIEKAEAEKNKPETDESATPTTSGAIDLESDGFADEAIDESDIRPTILVDYNNRSDMISGPKTIAEIRQETRLNIPADARPYLIGGYNSGEVDENFRVVNGMRVNFIKPTSGKG